MKKHDEIWTWGVIITTVVIMAVSLGIVWLLLPHSPTGLNHP